MLADLHIKMTVFDSHVKQVLIDSKQELSYRKQIARQLHKH